MQPFHLCSINYLSVLVIEAHLQTPISKIKSFADVVVQVCSHKWKEIGRALGYSKAEVLNFVSSESSNESKLAEVIEGWTDDKGKRATFGKLLDACDHVKMRGAVETKIEETVTITM